MGGTRECGGREVERARSEGEWGDGVQETVVEEKGAYRECVGVNINSFRFQGRFTGENRICGNQRAFVIGQQYQKKTQHTDT